MQLPISPELQWTLSRDGSYVPCGRTTHQLPPGAYTVYGDNCSESHFKPHPLHTDELIEFPESISAKVLAESRRGRHSQSMLPSLDTSAAVRQLLSRA